MKRCIRCKTIKSYDNFHKRTNSRDGLATYCKLCAKEYRSEYYKNNSDKLKEYARNFVKENTEKVKERRSRYYQNNKEKSNEYQKKYREEYPDKRRALKARRRARKLNATPPWLTEEHWNEIKLIYKEAARITKETGIMHHVDHIHPLCGETLCGLHVPWNLQILTAAENLSKNNKIKLDKPI